MATSPMVSLPDTQEWRLLSYMTAALQMGKALVNKTNMVPALMKLSLVEKIGIEQIITIVPSMLEEIYTIPPV